MKCPKARGFTLVESVVAMVIMGIAMVTIASFLLPQVLRSADPYYQIRALELGQSVMSKMLARGFADNSDFNGGNWRCGDDNTLCSTPLGPDGESAPQQFNDVDDYIGCWVPIGSAQCGDLNILADDTSGETYRNFRLDIAVSNDNSEGFAPQTMKKIELSITIPNQSPVELQAWRGNY